MDDQVKARVRDWRHAPPAERDWWHWRDALHGGALARAECGRGRTVAVVGMGRPRGAEGPAVSVHIATRRAEGLAEVTSGAAEWSPVSSRPALSADAPDHTGYGHAIGWATHDMLGGTALVAGCGPSLLELLSHSTACIGVLALVAQPGTATADDLDHIRAAADAGVVVVGDWCWRVVLGRSIAMVDARPLGVIGGTLAVPHTTTAPDDGAAVAVLVPTDQESLADAQAVLVAAALAAEWVRRHAAQDMPRRTRPAWVVASMRHSDRRHELAAHGYDVPAWVPPVPCLERSAPGPVPSADDSTTHRGRRRMMLGGHVVTMPPTDERGRIDPPAGAATRRAM